MAWWRSQRRSSGGPRGRDRYLVVLRLCGSDDASGKSFRLGPGEDVIGRDEGCSVQILDPEISRRHVLIQCDPGANTFTARDLESVNGTQVNGRRLTAPHLLIEEDVIEIGGSRLLFTGRRPDGHLRGLRTRRGGQGPVPTIFSDESDETEGGGDAPRG